MIDSNRKKTVIFDFGDTLASTVPTYPDRIKIAIQKLGFRFSDKEFSEAYQFADYQICKNYLSNGNISSKIYQDSLYYFLSDGLKIEMPREELKKMVKLNLKEIEYTRELLDNAGDMLEQLRSNGFKLAIISNNDGYTFEKCRELGINEYFEIVVDSTNVGMVKPDRNIYLYTLSELNIDPDEAVHIGDLYGADILGGINSGLDVIWFNHRNGENYENINLKQFFTYSEILESF